MFEARFCANWWRKTENLDQLVALDEKAKSPLGFNLYRAWMSLQTAKKPIQSSAVMLQRYFTLPNIVILTSRKTYFCCYRSLEAGKGFWGKIPGSTRIPIPKEHPKCTDDSPHCYTPDLPFLRKRRWFVAGKTCDSSATEEQEECRRNNSCNNHTVLELYSNKGLYF